LSSLVAWRFVAWSLGVVPVLNGLRLTLQGGLGANPVEYLEHYTGSWALRLLLVTLLMTPLRTMTRLTEPIRVRRVIGLWCFAFACMHLLVYLIFDLAFSFTQLLTDLMKRTYITLGFTAWLLLLCLAITSTTGWQRRLRRRWIVLHKLIYPAALLGAMHYLLLVKADIRQPLIYLGILVGLLLFRVPWWKRQGTNTANQHFRQSDQQNTKCC
jgi:methionine sulfoxide reductase heme-binding subunit